MTVFVKTKSETYELGNVALVNYVDGKLVIVYDNGSTSVYGSNVNITVM